MRGLTGPAREVPPNDGLDAKRVAPARLPSVPDCDPRGVIASTKERTHMLVRRAQGALSPHLARSPA